MPKDVNVFSPQSFFLKSLLVNILVSILLFTAVESLYAAHTGVLVTPTRVVFEGRTRAASVRLINPNDRPCTYRMSMVSIRMDEYGTRHKVENPNEEEVSVQKMIRFSPRSVTLQPGEWQTVRLMVRKPRGLADGEYRAHLKVAPVPGGDDVQQAGEQQQDKVSIGIDFVLNITIPVIIRHGRGSVEVRPMKPVLKESENREQYFLETELRRTGEYSVYGNLKAYHSSSDGAGKVEVGELKGFSIYTPNTWQIVRIPVSREKAALLSGGRVDLEVVSLETDDMPVVGTGSFSF